MPWDGAIKPGEWHAVIESGGVFPPAPDRYHLYIGLFCPFAHRVNLIRHLKSLTTLLPVSIVHPYPKGDDHGWPGWRFPDTENSYPGSTPDRLFASQYLHEIYQRAEPGYRGRFTVPVLWDTHTGTIVNNESGEILRFLETGFDDLLPAEARARNFYPAHLRARIDGVCEWMQRDLNLGVYRAGFAPDQDGYERNVVRVFEALNKLEGLLAESSERGPFMLGEELTEVDLRLFPTLIRFDAVYVQHFKCNLGTIRHDYPRLNRWVKYLYWNVPGFRETTDFKHIKENYTKSHLDINPKTITPLGPIPDVEEENVEEDDRMLRTGGVRLP